MDSNGTLCLEDRVSRCRTADALQVMMWDVGESEMKEGMDFG